MNRTPRESRLTCPECGHAETETLPVDHCRWFYECKACRKLLRPKAGDCCVFCSYGSLPCASSRSRSAEISNRG